VKFLYVYTGIIFPTRFFYLASLFGQNPEGLVFLSQLHACLPAGRLPTCLPAGRLPTSFFPFFSLFIELIR